MSSRPVLPGWPLALAVMAVAAAAAGTAPLLVYTLTLALFGGAHVFTELRFVEARFAGRLDQRLAWGIGIFLLIIVGRRLLDLFDLWNGTQALQLELILVAGLGALVLPTLAESGFRQLLVGILVVSFVGVGLLAAPIWTILILACLHNWTPLGFLAEGLPGPERRRGLLLAGLAFGLLPLAIALGLPRVLFEAVGTWAPNYTLLPSGPLSANLGAYLPASLHDAAWAPAVFSALVFAQCMHYATVIGVLPRMAPGGPEADAVVGISLIPRTWFVAGVVIISALGMLGWTTDFKLTRGAYGLIAAVHAWVEVPVLLLALVAVAGPSEEDSEEYAPQR